MFCVYILQSQKDLSYYVGHTDCLERRIEEHNKGKNKYTRARAPWKLVFKELYNTRGEAMKRECEIKRKKSRKCIELLINPIDWNVPI
jgi:putative endonuclease